MFPTYTLFFGMSLVSLINMLIICFGYFSKKRINTVENKLFSELIVAVLIGLVLEIGCYFAVIYMNDITYLLNNAVLKFYIIYIVWWAFIFNAYVITTTKKWKTKVSPATEMKHYRKVKKASIICLIVLSVIMLLLPIYPYYQDFIVYSYGPGIDYIVKPVTAACVLFWISRCFTNFKRIREKKFKPIIACIIGLSIVAFTQYLEPGALLVTTSHAVVIMLMYFTIENPDVRMLQQVTELKDQAEKANRAKSDFLSSMSHEIRTPLNAIVGLSEDIVTFKESVPSQVIEDSIDIQNASQTLLEIVGNILDISKIESEKLEIIECPYNFRKELIALTKVTTTKINEKPIDFKLNIAEDIPHELIGDKVRIKQVINNLLSNAIKYTDKGTVTVNAKCLNYENTCTLIISVQDTGRGIKAEQIERLFAKFDRLDVERNSTTEGTGLGLAITKKLVEMMNGRINVQSQYGEGSIFMVQIPQKISKMSAPLTETQLLKTTEIMAAKERDEKQSVIDFGHKKILIVDDNKLNIKVARRALDPFNFEIDECYDGIQCLERVNADNKYDLILLDIMMPNMSGETAMGMMKQIPGFDTPVIALTADAIAGAKEKYLEEGFTDYIAKPFSKEQIKEKLDIIFK